MFERSWTVTLPGGTAPAVITIQNVELPPTRALDGEFMLEAWAGTTAGGNVYVLEGDVTLAQAQEQLSTVGERIDCLTVVPGAGVSRVRIPKDIESRLTLFWDTANTASEAVTLRIREV